MTEPIDPESGPGGGGGWVSDGRPAPRLPVEDGGGAPDAVVGGPLQRGGPTGQYRGGPPAAADVRYSPRSAPPERRGPAVAYPVDVAIRRGLWALSCMFLAGVAAAVAVGPDGRIAADESYWLLPAGAFAAVSVGAMIGTALAAVATVREVRASLGMRKGVLRSMLVAGVTLVAVFATGLVVWGGAREAVDEGDRAAAIEAAVETLAEQGRPVRDDAGGAYARLRQAEAATCYLWPGGPLATEALGGFADPARTARVPCSVPHTHETVGTVEIPAAEGEPFPPDGTARFAEGQRLCRLVLLAFVTPDGAPTATETRLGAYPILPSPVEWEAGERTAGCIATPPPGVARVGSLAGTGS